MKNLYTTLVGVALLGLSSCACAAVIDFASVADGPVPGTTYGADNGEYGASLITFNAYGVPTLTATGTVLGGLEPAPAYAYLDAGNAGLGVCQTLNGTQCAPSSDDNVTYQEMLTLTFDEEVTFNDVSFVNGDHGTTFTGDFELFVDGSYVNTFALTNDFTMDLAGTVFGFYNPNSGGDSNVSNDQQFYLNTIGVNERGLTPPAVPIPAAVWLFMSGLLGLVAVARRKA